MSRPEHDEKNYKVREQLGGIREGSERTNQEEHLVKKKPWQEPAVTVGLTKYGRKVEIPFEQISQARMLSSEVLGGLHCINAEADLLINFSEDKNLRPKERGERIKHWRNRAHALVCEIGDLLAQEGDLLPEIKAEELSSLDERKAIVAARALYVLEEQAPKGISLTTRSAADVSYWEFQFVDEHGRSYTSIRRKWFDAVLDCFYRVQSQPPVHSGRRRHDTSRSDGKETEDMSWSVATGPVDKNGAVSAAKERSAYIGDEKQRAQFNTAIEGAEKLLPLLRDGNVQISLSGHAVNDPASATDKASINISVSEA